MRLNVPLDLTLSTYSARVWAEKRPYPEDSIQAAICKRLGKPAVQEVLHWEKSASAKTRRAGVEEVLYALDDVMNGSLSLVEFIARFGNFFPGQEISEGRARAEIAGIHFLAVMLGATKTNPPRAIYIEKWLLNPLKYYCQGLTFAERLVIAIREGEGIVLGDGPGAKAVGLLEVVEEWQPVWVEAKKGMWPVFRLPGRWPLTREEIIGYALGELRRNALTRLQRIKPCWGKGGLTLQPVCLADALLAFLFLGKMEQRPKSLSTEDRRAVENYFNEYRRRGKITLEQCKKAIAAVKDAWEAGERDRAMLREIGWAAIGMLPPRKRAR